jgi:uncharacterized protein (TIGR02391 family)
VEKSIASLIPNVDDLLNLEVEEVAWVLLAHLASLGDTADSRVQQGRIIQCNLFNDFDRRPPYPIKHRELKRTLMEAWAWLEREALLVRDAESYGVDAWFLSRRAKRLETEADFDAYRKAGLLPRGQLHPQIAVRVYPAFLRGEYDTAVFQAFREVEIAVRSAGRFPSGLIGVQLMRQAFRPGGPLADVSLPTSEQEGMMFLFTGAIGLYKNPQSHRYVPTLGDEAAEVIMFASQLLRIVDRVVPSQP